MTHNSLFGSQQIKTGPKVCSGDVLGLELHGLALLVFAVVPVHMIFQRFLGGHRLGTNFAPIVKGPREVSVLYMIQHIVLPCSRLATNLALKLVLSIASVVRNLFDVLQQNVSIVTCK